MNISEDCECANLRRRKEEGIIIGVSAFNLLPPNQIDGNFEEMKF